MSLLARLAAPLLLTLIAFVTAVQLHAQSRIPINRFEILRTTRSNVDLRISNYGIVGLDVAASKAGGFWPRGTTNAYIFGGGLWFGAQKRVDDTLSPLSVIAYDPNNGGSWMVPGIREIPSSASNFRLYLSGDYDQRTGEPIDAADVAQGGPNWPVWSVDESRPLGFDGYTGEQVSFSRRNTASSGIPVFVSSEDAITTYNDSDPTLYNGEDAPGLPLGIQVEQAVYSWDTGFLRDVVMIRYRIINVSGDTLFDSHIGLVLDLDVGSANNDRSKIAIRDRNEDSLDLGVTWSEREAKRLGYFGLDLVETPETDLDGFVLGYDGRVDLNRHVGMSTFQNFSLEEDPVTPAERYAFMSAGDRDDDTHAGDTRVLMSTESFHMRPGDTANATFALMFSMNAGTDNPNGTRVDMEPLLALDRQVQKHFDSTFVFNRFGFASMRDESINASPLSIYPNPAASPAQTIAAFTLDKGADTRIRIIDLHGATVSESELGYLNKGQDRVTIRTDDLPSGIYLVVINAGSQWMRSTLCVQNQ